MKGPVNSGSLAVRSVFWRRCIDWVVKYLPAWLHPLLILISTLIFFVLAVPARRTVRHHLQVLFPNSSHLTNLFRTFHVFYNFAWTLTDSAVYRILRKPFRYELEGEEFLNQLATAKGAILLTAHMGNYDLGSAVFVEKLHREIRIVRAPEPDTAAAEHLGHAIDEAAGGGVKVDYNTAGSLLSFDLLHALRRGEIISIQGDRAMGEVAQFPVQMFGQTAFLPSGPIVLALTAEVPVFPLFVVRTGYRHYRIITRAPFACARSGIREADISAGLQRWADVLAETLRHYWSQWHIFTPVFKREA